MSLSGCCGETVSHRQKFQCVADGIGIRTCLRNTVFRVRLSGDAPNFGESMTIADGASVAALAVDLIALYFLIGIWRDDRAMRIAAEESLKAQIEYLGLRRKWYESRTKRKDNAQPTQEQKIASGVPVSRDSDTV